MGQFKLKIEELAERHLKQHYRSGDKASIKKIEKIFKELSETPYVVSVTRKPSNTNLPVFGRDE